MDKRYRRKLDLHADRVIQAYQGGMTLREIADIYEVSPMTVCNFLKKREVARRRRGPKYADKQAS